MQTDLLKSGIYSFSEASKFLRVSQQKLRGWVLGHPRSSAPPLIENEIGKLDGQISISFVNLIEARLISEFARYGVSKQAIRAIMDEAKRFADHDHPFATDFMFRTDGKDIFVHVAKETGDERLYHLKKKNFAFFKIIEDSLKEGIVYGGELGLADRWYPRKASAPNVILHPHHAFGKPVVDEEFVPTRALFDAFSAEGATYQSVANWFQVATDRVQEAVRFELELQAT